MKIRLHNSCKKELVSRDKSFALREVPRRRSEKKVMGEVQGGEEGKKSNCDHCASSSLLRCFC